MVDWALPEPGVAAAEYRKADWAEPRWVVVVSAEPEMAAARASDLEIVMYWSRSWSFKIPASPGLLIERSFNGSFASIVGRCNIAMSKNCNEIPTWRAES